VKALYGGLGQPDPVPREPTPSTYPLHLACLACEPAEVFFTLYHLFLHLHRQHPEQLNRSAKEAG
jgi:hypothetical protein